MYVCVCVRVCVCACVWVCVCVCVCVCVYEREREENLENHIFWRDDRLGHVECNMMSLKTKMAAIFEVISFELLGSTMH